VKKSARHVPFSKSITSSVAATFLAKVRYVLPSMKGAVGVDIPPLIHSSFKYSGIEMRYMRGVPQPTHTISAQRDRRAGGFP
jgi:hypothetical protein